MKICPLCGATYVPPVAIVNPEVGETCACCALVLVCGRLEQVDDLLGITSTEDDEPGNNSSQPDGQGVSVERWASRNHKTAW